MREIKFRAWDKSGELKMLPVSQLSWDEHDDGVVRLHFCGCIAEKLAGSFGVHSGFGNVDGSEDTGWVLMQYTGLKDKNGKEIYEGDIVHHLKYGGNYEVLFTPENTGYDLKNGDKQMHLSSVCCPNLEKIGNIYENPELLEV